MKTPKLWNEQSKRPCSDNEHDRQQHDRTHLAADAIQSTPHLIAWLYFGSLLADADVAQVKAELIALARNLDPHFDKFYREAQQCRAVAAQGARLAMQDSWITSELILAIELSFKHGGAHPLYARYFPEVGVVEIARLTCQYPITESDWQRRA